MEGKPPQEDPETSLRQELVLIEYEINIATREIGQTRVKLRDLINRKMAFEDRREKLLNPEPETESEDSATEDQDPQAQA